MTVLMMDDIVDVVAATIFTLVAFAVLWSVFSLEAKVLRSKSGWFIMGIAVMLFGVRAYGHFIAQYWFQLLRHVIGLTNAVLLPVALYLIHKQYRESR